jgi:hypothetical protein
MLLLPTRSLVHALVWSCLTLAACGGGGGPAGEGALRINEVVSDNKRAFLDELGEADDYIELVNADARPIRLSGYTLEDKSGERARLPDRVLGPGEVVLLFADAAPDQGPEHLPFKLGSGGDRLVLRGALQESDRLEIPSLGPDQALMRVPHAEGRFVPCDRPSPGRRNADRCDAR